jgi:UDP-glucose 4-epimerase
LEVYNVGSGRPVAIRDILAALVEESGKEIIAVPVSDRMRASDVPRAEGKFEKFFDRYGWAAKTPLRTTAAAVLTHEIGRHGG